MTYVLLAVVALALAGCGGGGDREPATARSVLMQTTSVGMRTNAQWVAVQDGDGPWRVLGPVELGTYTTEVQDPAGRYSFAILSADANRVNVQVYHHTLAELARFGYSLVNLNASGSPRHQLTGTVTGGAGSRLVEVNFGYTGLLLDYQNDPAEPKPFSFTVNPGTYDLLAARYGAGGMPERLWLARDIGVFGPVTRDIDLSQGTALADVRTVHVRDAVDTAYAALITRNSTWAELGRLGAAQTPGSFNYAVMPSEMTDPADLYQVNIGKFSETSERSSQTYFRTPDNRVVYLPQPFDSPSVEVPASAPGRPTVTWERYPDAVYYRMEYIAFNTPGTGHTIWSVVASRDWLGNRGAYTLPDLSALEGWQATWGLPRVDWWRMTAVASERSYRELIGMWRPETAAPGDTPMRIAAKKGYLTARGRGVALPPAPSRAFAERLGLY